VIVDYFIVCVSYLNMYRCKTYYELFLNSKGPESVFIPDPLQILITLSVCM
jgi:hypothetical protein